jgi:hypothetical protein
MSSNQVAGHVCGAPQSDCKKRFPLSLDCASVRE